MPGITAVAHALPSYAVSQHEVRKFAEEFFAGALPVQRYLKVFDHAAVQRRHFVVPISWFTQDHSFPEKNRLYIESAQQLAEQAAKRCLAGATLEPSEIDHLVFVSSTGLATPTLDARLIQRMGFRPDIKRTPLWGLGCAGGAIGLSRTWGWSQADASQNSLLLAVECCSLTFLHSDRSKRNLVASALFADGAAAVLIEGRPRSKAVLRQARVLAAHSYTWPDTEHIMGWQLVAGGLQVVFSAEIPGLVHTHMREQVEAFLDAQKLTVADIRHWIVHPGGARVLTAYQEALGLSDHQLSQAHHILAHYGNMSSPTVLFVLQLAHEEAEPGDHGLLMALGPGFSLEILLLRWDEA